MNNILNIIKKIALFLFGVILIIWGYKANAANTEKEGKAIEPMKDILEPVLNAIEEKNVKPEDEPKPVQEPKKQVTPQPTAKEKKVDEKKIEEPQQTVIEKATPEESSGTE